MYVCDCFTVMHSIVCVVKSNCKAALLKQTKRERESEGEREVILNILTACKSLTPKRSKPSRVSAMCRCVCYVSLVRYVCCSLLYFLNISI